MVLVFLLYFLLMYLVFIKSPVILAYPFPFFFTAMQCFFASTSLFALYLLYKRKPILQNLSLQDMKRVTVLGLTLFGIPFAGFAYAMQYISSVTVCFILAGKPFMNVGILYMTEGKLLSRQQVLGMTIGLAGLLPIIFSMKPVVKSVDLVMVLFGTVLFAIATAIYSYGWILLKEDTKTMKYISVTEMSILTMFVSGVFVYMIHLFTNFTFIPQSIDAAYWPAIAWVGLISGIIYWLYGYLLQTFSTTFLAFATFLQPGLGLLYAYFVFGQAISFFQIVCLILLVVGLYIFYREEL